MTQHSNKKIQKQIDKKNFINDYPNFGKDLLLKYGDVSIAQVVVENSYIGQFKHRRQYIKDQIDKTKKENPNVYESFYECHKNTLIIFYYIDLPTNNPGDITDYFEIKIQKFFIIYKKKDEIHVFREV